MEREPSAVQNVRDLRAEGKRWLEDLLGQPLCDNQQVFMMVFTPGKEPDEAARQKARAGLEQTWARVEQHMQQHGITAEEFDAAVDEALEHVRRRPS